MDQCTEYACRGVIISDDAIKCMNKNATGLVKSFVRANTRATFIAVAATLIAVAVVTQRKEIKALKQQIANLTIKTHGIAEE